ncbi:MAG: SIS domain-containing protein, partial [Verrucomicrobiota bacterium]
MITQWIAEYLEAQKRAVDSLKPAEIAALVETLRGAWSADRQIFAIGTGGSAAHASHFAVALGKGSSDKLPRRFRVLSLTDNVAWMTALGNDSSYDEI